MFGNLDKFLLDSLEEIYQNSRKNTFIENFAKHFREDCNCSRLKKKCICTGIIDLSRFGEKKYLETLYQNNVLDTIYNMCQSTTQSLRSKTGRTFEDIIERLFIKYNISFDKQIHITPDGYLINTKQNGCHSIDFIVPKPKSYPLLIKDFEGEFISCKTTVRERYLQDL